jgi:hypothetical protein
VQLLRRPTTDHAYRQPDTNANTNPDANSDSNPDANPDTDSDSNAHSDAYAYTNAHSNADADADADTNSNSNSNPNSDANPDAGSRTYSATGNKRHAESCHAGRSGSLDDRSEPDAHQSGAWDPAEHRQRPLHRWIGQLPAGPSRLPDGSWIGHDLDAFYRCIQHHPGSFRPLL